MENKTILLRRIIYLVLAVLSLVFISFYGGNVPYMFFWLVVINTVASVIYIVFVFFSVKIYQDVPKRRVVKNEFVTYKLQLNNESLLAFRQVSLKFLDQLSTVSNTQELSDISLEPGESYSKEMDLICKYSGTYYVGVDNIWVMDYFKIFRMHFHMPQQLQITVVPRVLMPADLSAILENEESHNSSAFGSSMEIIDNEVRVYQGSDNKRLIHWRNSAKQNKLMVRNMSAKEISQYVVIADSRFSKKDFTTNIIVKDKMRELMLAFVNYIYNQGFVVDAILDFTNTTKVSNKRDFDELLDKIIDYGFDRGNDIGEFVSKLDGLYDENVPFIIITSATDEYSIQDVTDRNCYVINVNDFDKIDEFLKLEV